MLAISAASTRWWATHHMPNVQLYLSVTTKISPRKNTLEVQGESLARGPKLLSIKNYVIEIMT